MNKIIEYKVVKNSSDSSIRLINAYILNGWQPFGSPFGDSIQGSFQALVKYEEEPKDTMPEQPQPSRKYA